MSGEEIVPLLPGMASAAESNARQGKCTLLLLLLVCLLERCTFYEYIADVLQSQPDQSYNKYCDVLGDNNPMNLDNSWKSHILVGLAYILPLLGGFAADRRFGCCRVLLVGCGLYCIGSCMMVCMIYAYNVLCNNTLKYFCQVVLAFATGLVRPNLMVLSYELGEPLVGTVGLCYLYYGAEVIGQVLGSSLSFATDIIQKPLTAFCVPTTIAMLCLAGFASRFRLREQSPNRFYRPPKLFIKLTLYLITPIILQSSVLMLSLFTLSGWEMTYLKNQTTHEEMIVNSDLIMLIWSVALLPVITVLFLLTQLVNFFKSPIARVSLGICALAICQFQSCCFNLFLPRGRSTLDYVLGYQIVLAALVEALTYIAANEMAFRIAACELRTFIVGLFMSLKGAGFLATIIILFISIQSNKDNNDSLARGFAYMHLGIGIALLASLSIVLIFSPSAYEKLLKFKEADDQRIRESESQIS